MDLKKLMFMKAAIGGGGDTNLLVYSDLVNKNYSGSANMHNVRPEHIIAVTPGATLILDGPLVSQTDIRFYDENETYQSSKTFTTYGEDRFEFTVPEGMYYMLPKWYLSTDELPVETFIQSNPSIKYA